MCHWKKWFWPGLLTVALLSVLALWWKTDSIEQELQARAAGALTEQGHSWASVEMDGRDAILTGSAPNEDAQEIAEFLADDAYDVRVVNNQSGLIAAQSPYALNAKRARLQSVNSPSQHFIDLKSQMIWPIKMSDGCNPIWPTAFPRHL